MPHLRQRYILELIRAKLQFAPVFALQGARQTGKSYLAKEILSKKLASCKYYTFDEKSIRTYAEKRPDTFLIENQQYHPLIIDEAQKVPDIFDAIKLQVDEKRIPGKFFILGSTEFSKLTNIRESLTGRMSRAKLHPLTIRESLSLKPSPAPLPFYLSKKAEVTRAEFLRYLKSGGMPGIFTIKDEQAQKHFAQNWVDLTVERDIHTFKNVSLSSELALEILVKIATLEEPSLANISKAINTNARRISTHIKALEGLFAINKLSPHRSGTGKDIYFIVDTVLAKVLGASFETLLYTTALNEQLAKASYFEKDPSQLTYYRNSKGKIIHLVSEKTDGSVTALKIIADERYDARDFELLIAFKKKIENKVTLIALAPTEGLGSKELVKVFPWEAIA